VTASVATRVQADVVIRLAPEGPGGVPANRRIGRMAIETDQVHAETQDVGEEHGADEPAPSVATRLLEFEREMMTAPGFMTDWACE